MELAHGSMMGDHMGIKKTVGKIQSSFYWPGIQGDMTRYYKSCDVCQKTVNKGSVPKVPLEKMPLIDKPFKRVAIDLVGPIGPPSEDGHRYILKQKRWWISLVVWECLKKSRITLVCSLYLSV